MIDDSYTAPFILAEFLSSNPATKTIIFYNLIQCPTDDDQPWTNSPYTLSVHMGGYVWARVDDDKGHVTARHD